MTTTESFSNYNHLEKKTTSELLQIINKEDKTVPLIIEKSLKEISVLIDKIFERMIKEVDYFILVLELQVDLV